NGLVLTVVDTSPSPDRPSSLAATDDQGLECGCQLMNPMSASRQQGRPNMSEDSTAAASPPAAADQGTTTRAESGAEAGRRGQRPSAAPQVTATLVPEEGWHFLHLFYRVDRGRLADLPAGRKEQGVEDLKRILGDRAAGGPEQLQCFAVPGHKADFGVI